VYIPIHAGFRIVREQLAANNVDPQQPFVVWIPARTFAKGASRTVCVLNRACI
jgi:hypothetical protein